MKMQFNYDGNSFLAGGVACAVAVGLINIYWLAVVPVLLTSFEIKGMPYAALTYKTGEGWRFNKGRYK